MFRKFLISIFIALISVSAISAQDTVDSLKAYMKSRVRYAAGSVNAHEKLNQIMKLTHDRYGEDSKEYRRAILWCSGYCAEAGDMHQAKKLFNKVRRHMSDTLEQIAALNTIIRIHRDGNETLAISKMKSLEKLQSGYYGQYSDERLNTLLDIAELYSIMGRNDKSDLYLSLASEVLRRKLDNEFSVSTEKGRSMYWDKVARFFERFTDVAYNESDGLKRKKSINRNAFDALLLSKGILMSTEREYEKFISNLEDVTADSLYAAKKELIVHNAKMHQIEAADDRLVRYLNGQGYRYHNPQFDVSWTDVQNSVGNDDIVIEFFKTGMNMFGALYFKKGWKAPECMKITGLVRQGDEILPLTSVLPYEPDEKNPKRNMQLSSSVAEIVWPEKLLQHFPETKDGKVYFSTVAELDITPIEYMGDMHERYNMCRLSSTRQLVSRRERNVRKDFRAGLYGGVDYSMTVRGQKEAADSIRARYKDADDGVVMRDHEYEALFAPMSHESNDRGAVAALPSSIEEVVSISEMCRSSNLVSDVFTGRYASEEAFKLFSADEHILHFATHGFYYSTYEAWRNLAFDDVHDYSDPMLRSGLKLAGVNGKDYMGIETDRSLSDGLLIAREIAQVNLSDAELIVLSACNSGKGDIQRDGVFGIQRAFKIAGANTIIMSLWPVGDEVAKDMMVMFYYNLTTGDGMAIYDAFYKALASLRVKYPNDYHWSPFVILDAI